MADVAVTPMEVLSGSVEENELALTTELRQVAQARAGLEAARNRLTELKAIHGIDMMEEALVAQGRMVSECEALARAIGLQLYEQTQQKNLVAGMKIREKVNVLYTAEMALAYCQEHAPALLRFDAKAFEKLAKAVIEAGQALDWVRLEKLFEATIPTDLNGLLMENWIIQTHEPKEGGDAPTGA